jgi:hypothetical protein
MGWVRVMNGVDAVGGESEGRVVSKVIRVGAACLGCELNQRFVYCLLLVVFRVVLYMSIYVSVFSQSTTAVHSLPAVQCKETESSRLFKLIQTQVPAQPGSSQAPKLSNTPSLPQLTTSTMPTSSRFTEHIDTATTRQSTSPECDVRLDDILKMSISQTYTQKARAWSGSSSGSSSTSREEQPPIQEKKTKRGSRFLGRKV